jgi:hypothetical protein
MGAGSAMAAGSGGLGTLGSAGTAYGTSAITPAFQSGAFSGLSTGSEQGMSLMDKYRLGKNLYEARPRDSTESGDYVSDPEYANLIEDYNNSGIYGYR